MMNMNASNLEIEIASILFNISSQANSRKGGAWMTGLCVVGKDMDTGLYQAEQVINSYQFDKDKSDKQKCADITEAIKELAKQFNGHDSEGYVVGTILEVASQIEALNK